MTEKEFARVRRALLTTWSTGKAIRHPWFFAGCSPAEKRDRLADYVLQVGLLKEYLEKDGTGSCSWGRAIALVKHVLYKLARLACHAYGRKPSPQQVHEEILHLFRVQLGEEKSKWTLKSVKVSDYVVRTYKGDPLEKYIKRGNAWYERTWVNKVTYVDPERGRWWNGTKEERAALLIEKVARLEENEFLTDALLWEHLVEFYGSWKGSRKGDYANIMLAMAESEQAPYSKRWAYELLREFFTRALLAYGVNLDKVDTTFVRKIDQVLEVFGTIDMFYREKKRGYSVVDILTE